VKYLVMLKISGYANVVVDAKDEEEAMDRAEDVVDVDHISDDFVAESFVVEQVIEEKPARPQ